MKSYAFDLVCPLCDSPMEHVNGARQNEVRSMAIVSCGSCHYDYSVTVRLERIARHPDAAGRKRDQRARAKANA